LLGLEGECADMRGWIEAYEAGLAAWRAGDFADAMRQFERARSERPGDAAAALMIDRCRHQIENPAPEGWDGTTVARAK
jgi:adenylate cyclase